NGSCAGRTPRYLLAAGPARNRLIIYARSVAGLVHARLGLRLRFEFLVIARRLVQQLRPALLETFYHRDDSFVVWHAHAERLRLAHQRAIECVDLGAASLLDVLHHRGAVVADAAMVLDLLARVGLGKAHTLAFHHREDLVDHAILQRVDLGRAVHLAAAQSTDRRERVDR